MMSPFRLLSRRRLSFLIVTMIVLAALVSFADSSSSQQQQGALSSTCQAHQEESQSQYTCPNCGGLQVDDCLSSCDGYTYGDSSHHICIRRVLLSRYNTNTTDYAHHYHYLWNDLLGMLVWFVTAAIAISAGVGGGGIYVPLGILLFQFAYV